MPLVPQQDIITITHQHGGPKDIGESLRAALLTYPDVRIVSIASSQIGVFMTIIAVVETI